MTATVNSSNVSRPALLAEDAYGDDPFGPGPAPRRRGRRIVTLVTVVVLVAALAGVTLSSTGASGARYRVATVTNADATAVLDGVATIEPVSQASVAFPIAGTVTHVAVKTGQTVRAGQTLAAVDTTSLYETIHTDEASLAQAKLTLADALDGTSSGSGASGSGASESGASGSSSGTAILTAATTSNSSTSTAASSQYAVTRGSTPTTSATMAPAKSAPSKSTIAAAQQAVVAAQAKVDRALADADAAIKAAETVCGAATTHVAIGPSNTTAPTTAPTTSTTASSTTPVGSCTAALQTSLAAQQSVSVAQRSLDSAVQHLTALLDAEASAPTSNTNGTSASGSGQSASTGAHTGVATGGGSSTTKTATAADLEADQARVDAATAKLDVAVQALAQARITTPIAGTVIAVNIAAGDSVSANSSTETIIVEGAKGYEVATSVPVAQITRVAVGQQASVLPDGAASTLNGRVTEISAVPATSTTGTTTYDVVISLDHAPDTLQDGTTGSVSIITDAAKAAVVVPSSAVHTSGKNHTVTVALGGWRAKTVSVTVGVQGTTTTQIKRGLAAGQHVVIADLNKALPSSATSTQSSSRTNRNGVSGLGGTGAPPSGFTPPSR